MFYTFSQNNSGGEFEYDEKQGISYFVIIEADNVEEANYRAENIGLYFDGCEDEIDCPCCGDRWYPAYKNGTKEPTISDRTDLDNKEIYGLLWMKGYETFVHYKTGEIKGYMKGDK